MTDRFDFNFTNDEHELFVQMKTLKTPQLQKQEEDSGNLSYIGNLVGLFVVDDVAA